MEVDTYCAPICCWVVACAKGFIVRTDFVGEAQYAEWTQTRFFYLGTERTAMTSLVPFRLVPQGRIELRRTLQTVHKLSVWGWTYSLDYSPSVGIKYTMDPGVPNHGETDLPSFPRSERETNESGEISGRIKKMAFVFRIVYLVLLYAFPCLGFKTKGV